MLSHSNLSTPNYGVLISKLESAIGRAVPSFSFLYPVQLASLHLQLASLHLRRIWKRKAWAIVGSIALAVIIGWTCNPNYCLENFDADYCGYDSKSKESTWDETLAGGIFVGLGFIIYIELSYAAIKYENYAEQFKPAGMDDSLLTDAQKKGVSKTLRTQFVSYLVNLGVMLFLTFTMAEIVININDYLSTTDGIIQDSIELQGPYGIVFTSLIFLMLLGFVRMFVGADYETEES